MTIELQKGLYFWHSPAECWVVVIFSVDSGSGVISEVMDILDAKGGGINLKMGLSEGEW